MLVVKLGVGETINFFAHSCFFLLWKGRLKYSAEITKLLLCNRYRDRDCLTLRNNRIERFIFIIRFLLSFFVICYAVLENLLFGGCFEASFFGFRCLVNLD